MDIIIKIAQFLLNLFCGDDSKQQQQPAQDHPQFPGHYPHQQEGYPSHEYPPHGHQDQDQNQINQSNPYYLDLRKRANEEGDAMANCFRESQEAYHNGDGARAKELSNEGKEHQQQMEKLNREASEWIFIENNKDSAPGEIDLHGLYVKEAIEYTDRSLEEAKMNGQHEVRLIVGKGLHSTGGVAKIKPAIEELMIKHQLIAELDPENAGVLVVQVNTARDRGVGPDELARRLETKDDNCIVM